MKSSLAAFPMRSQPYLGAMRDLGHPGSATRIAGGSGASFGGMNASYSRQYTEA